MAEGSDRLACLVKITHDVENFFVEAQVFRRTSSRNNKGVIVSRVDVIERRIQREVVATLFGIRLIALKIVDRGPHLLTFFLSRSEEHTSELQSPRQLVSRLLLQKKAKPEPQNGTI